MQAFSGTASPSEVLQKVWKYPAFRPLQEEIISSVLAGKDTIALLPTGGGKSICFQVPGLIFPGLTLVISPLIALMQDQVEQLNRRGIPATFINSTLSRDDITRRIDGVRNGKYKFLYCAPERLRTEVFRQQLSQFNVSLLAIDEAHCISQWGYDFRPSYLQIPEIKPLLGNIPTMALTATATPRVRDDIADKLSLEKPECFQKSFRRTNLAFKVSHTDNVVGRILALVQKHSGTGIIYARTRKRTEKLAHLLESKGESAAFYHGGMNSRQRKTVQQDWISGKSRVVVATNAFGMGIDKADVRFVIHLNLPADLESYYQEAGRAGRDGELAYAYAFYNLPDVEELKRWVAEKYPSWEQLNKHYIHLCDYFQVPTSYQGDELHPFDIVAIARRFKTGALPLYNSAKLLDKEGVIALHDSPETAAWIRVIVSPDTLLQYKEKYPESELLIDSLLRSLGGEVFHEERKIHPEFWAKKVQLSEEELFKWLEQLAARKLIEYRSPTELPTIRFLMPRHTLSKRELNWSKYQFLREQAQRRLKALLDYTVNTRYCRSKIIEAYFGEKNSPECGHCDVCIAKKSKGGRYEEVWDEVKKVLENAPLTYGELAARLRIGTEKQRQEALKYFLDKKWIRVSIKGEVSLP